MIEKIEALECKLLIIMTIWDNKLLIIMIIKDNKHLKMENIFKVLYRIQLNLKIVKIKD